METLDSKQYELEGILVYVGAPGAGKTYLAYQHLQKLKAKGVRCIVIDSTGALNFREEPHVKNLSEAVDALWGKDTSKIIYWKPQTITTKAGRFTDKEQVSKFCEVARDVQGPPIAILIDEFSFWKDSTELRELCRTWRHSNATILLTTQHISADVGQVVFGCDPLLFLFRTTAPRSVEFILKWYGIETQKIKNLPDWEHIVMRF